MEKKLVNINVEWEWLESNIMPDLKDTFELDYHQEQFNRDDLREYVKYIIAWFIDEPEPAYIQYWEKALRPTEQHFKSFKSYFEKNGFKYDDQVYHKLFFVSLILWRNFAYNGTEKSTKDVRQFFQMISEKNGVKMTRKKLLTKKRKGIEIEVTLGKEGVKDGSRARSYIYWTGKLFGALSEIEGPDSEKRIIELIGFLFCTATEDFKEKYKSYLKKPIKPGKKKQDWNRYLYETVRSYKNDNPSFKKEALADIEKFILKLNDGKDIKLSDSVIPDYVRRRMRWSNELRILTEDDIEEFISAYCRYRPYFTKKGTWPIQYDNPKSKVRTAIKKEKLKAKRVRELQEFSTT